MTTRWTSGAVALLLVMAMAWVGLPAHADPVGGTTADGFVWEADDDDVAAGATIVDYTGSETDIMIPSTISDGGTDYAVVTIGAEAFRSKGLTSVTIPDTVEHITGGVGEGAFSSNLLESLSIPASVRHIGSSAFRDNRLTSLVIPETVNTVSAHAFRENLLTSVSIPDSLTVLNSGVFADNALAEVTIPDTVTWIGNSTFSVNDLTSVTIPDSVATIEPHAFRQNALTEVTIGSGVEEIGLAAFAYNDNLADVTFTGPAPTIAPAAENGSFGEAEGKTLFYPWIFDDSQVADGYTTPTWEGYTSVALDAPISCDWEWTGDESDAWTDPDNWDGLAADRYPGESGDADSVVCIDADDNLPVVATLTSTATIGSLFATAEAAVGLIVNQGTLVIEDEGTFTDAGLHLGNPAGDTTNRALVVNGTLDVHGDSRWFRGTLTGDGTTTFHGDLDGPADPRTRLLDGHDLVLEGDSTVQNSGFFLADGATLTNRGTMELSTAILHDQTVGSTLPLPVLRNEGTIAHTPGVTNWLAVQFDNEPTGALVVEAGTLRLDRFGTNSGDMTVEAGATLQFNLSFPGTSLGPRYVSTPDGSITGAGTLHISTPRGLVSQGDLDVGALRLVATGGAYLELAADGTAGYLEVSRGWPRGAGGVLTVTGDVDYFGQDTRQVFGSGAPMVINADGDLWLTSTQLKIFADETLVTIDGDAVHDQGRVRVIDSELDVDGTWTMTGDDSLLTLNDGTVRSAGMTSDDGTRIEGIGTIRGTLGADGEVAPGLWGSTPFGAGSTYGTLHVTRDVTFSASTIFEVRVGGTEEGEHDLLHVDTHADIAGAGLVVLVEEDTELVAGDRIPILTTASLTTVAGTFGSEDLPDLPGDLVLEVEYEADAVYLVVAQATEDDDVVDDNGDVEDPADPADPTDPGDGILEDGDEADADADPTDEAAEPDTLPETGVGLSSLVGWLMALMLLGLMTLRTGSRMASRRG